MMLCGARDEYSESKLSPDKPQLLLKKHVLAELLMKAQVMRDGAFDREAVIDATMADEFASYCFEHKAQIERMFNVSIRGDVRRNPINQLNAILKVLGLSVVKFRRDQSGGTSRIQYQLKTKRLDILERWVARRSDTKLREAWREQRTGENTEFASDPNVIHATSTDPLDQPGV